MDDFSQKMYAAAQARQKKIDNKFNELGLQKKPPLHESQPNMPSSSEFEDFKRQESSSDSQLHLKENVSPTRSKFTRVSSEMPGKESPNQKTLNIQKENFEMEIKLKSSDDVRVEVEIEEHDEDGLVTRSHESVVQPLRKSVKTRLQKLGKLYSNEDCDLSSPIQRTEDKFDQSSGDYEDKSPVASKKVETEARKKRLAQLASNLNNWEDDVAKKKDVKSPPRKSWKQPAPQPPKKEEPKKGPAPKPPKNNWDKKVIDNLESQGFSRVKSGSELPKTPDKENNTSPIKRMEISKSPSKSILSKAAFFEGNSPTKASPKDPALLSVSERKALFEKNKGDALIPKAAFGMAAPVKPEIVKPEISRKPIIVESTIKPTTCANENSGIAGKLKALLHQATTISETQIKQQRDQEKQKELDMLKNRFVKPKEEVDSKVESEESDEDNEDESQQMLKNHYNKNVTFKASRESLASLTSRKSLTSLKKSFEEGAKSLLGVGNSMQKLNESPSPKAKKLHKRRSSGEHPVVQEVLDDVKRIKVVPPKNGHLYPCLSDIEASSTANEDTDRAEQSDEQSSIIDDESSTADSDMADTSFGREILAAVNRNHEVLKTTSKLHNSTTTSSDLSDVLNEMNDYLDEQESDESSDEEAGPTPPKHRTPGGGISSSSFNYSSTETPKYGSPSKNRISKDSDEPLMHTVSFYRKQQNVERTPIKKIIRSEEVVEESPEKEDPPEQLIEEKIKELMDEVCKQQTVISQTSQAINLCSSTIEFSGSSEEVEAERLLLLATQRRQAALHEAQRLRIERTLRPISTNRGIMDVDHCSITLSEIALPIKRDYIRALTAAGGLGHHLLCLIRYAEHVHVTPLVATGNPPNPPQIIARIPGTLKLEQINPDFTITVEVYSMQAHEEIIPHEVKYHIKKTKSTPKKSKLQKIQSPAGPTAVRTSSFQLMGYIVFSIREVNRTQWVLNKVPHVSPLEGQLLMHVECDVKVNVDMHGFLNMFEDLAGFGAWHRRWCHLKGDTLSYWKYPEDERKKPPIGSISLQGCVTDSVGLVSRDICARPNTFLLEFVRPKQSGDVDSLVMIVQNEKTLIRHLLSADTKEERIEWCKQMNKALSTMKSLSGK